MDDFMSLWREGTELIRSRPYTAEKRERVHQIQEQLQAILNGMEQPDASGGSPPVPLGPARINGGTTN